MKRPRAGFTLIEILMVIVLVGIMMTVAIPYLRSSSAKTNVRGAGDEISRLYATARSVSIARGKIAWLVLNSSASTAEVIAGKVNGSGIDTIAKPDNLASRYNVTFTTSSDSLVFTPRGIGANLVMTTVVLSSSTGGIVDTVYIYPTGKIVR
jgi:type II secretion system protein H